MSGNSLVKVNYAYQALFGKKQINKAEVINNLLKCISRDDCIFYCCKLNYLLYNKNNQIDVLNFLSPSSDIYGQLLEYIQKGKLIFSKIQVFILLERCCLLCNNKSNDGETFNNVEVRDAFVKLLAICGEIWIERTYKGFQNSNAKQFLMLAARKSFEMEKRSKTIENSFTIGLSIFNKYMKQEIPDYESIVNSTYGMNTDDLFLVLLFIYCNFIKGLDIKTINDNSVDYTHSDFVKIIVERLSRTPDALKQEIIINQGKLKQIMIKTKPIFRTSKGFLLVFDPILLFEYMELGFLFDIKSAFISDGNRKFQQLVGHYGDAFHKYVLDLLYDKIGNSVKSSYSFDLLIDKDKLIDAYIDYFYKGVAIEIKAKLIKEDKCEDFIEYETEIDEKIGDAIEQIVSFIHYANDNDVKYLKELQRLYPVIITRDNYLSAPLAVEYFNKKLQNLLGSSGLTNCRFKILPLFILTMEELVIILSSKYSIVDFLDIYNSIDFERRSNVYASLSSDRYDREKIIQSRENQRIILEELEKAKDFFVKKS